MNNPAFFLCIAIVSGSFFQVNSAEYPEGRLVKRSELILIRQPENVVVIVYAHEQELQPIIDKFRSSQSAFEQVLKVQVQSKIFKCENLQQFSKLFLEESTSIAFRGAQGQSKIVLIVKGEAQTREVLQLLSKEGTPKGVLLASILGTEMKEPIHSIILFNPTVTKVYGSSPIIPNYDNIYRRIYNFYTQADDYGSLYRHLYPANQGKVPDANFYFKGVNINCKKIQAKGKIGDMSLKTIEAIDFNAIAQAIGEVDKFKMHTTFNVLLANDTAAAAVSSYLGNYPIPLVWIRENYGVEIIDRAPSTAKQRNYQIKTLIAKSSVQKGSQVTQAAASKLPLLGGLAKGMIKVTGAAGAVCGLGDWCYESGIFSSRESYVLLMEQINKEDDADLQLVKKFQLNETIQPKKAVVATNEITLEDFEIIHEDREPKQASVREFGFDRQTVDGGLNGAERQFLSERKQNVKQALERRFHKVHIEDKDVPTIAVVASGGGSRAMFATFGVLKGLALAGIFDAVTYICCLSGSTWAVGGLYDYFVKNQQETLLDLINSAGNKAAEQAYEFNFVNAFVTAKALRTALPDFIHNYFKGTPKSIETKQRFGQPVTNTDYYGAEIAKTLLGKGDEIFAENYTPTLLSMLYAGPSKPLPIFTAAGISHDKGHPVWFEFTPFEIGAIFGTGDNRHGAFVSTWAFGSPFKHGLSMNIAPEQPLEYYLGVFGSALNVSVKDLKGYLPGWLKLGFLNPDWRFAYAEVLNPFKGLRENRYENFSKPNTIGIFDAGLLFNLPYPPLDPHGILRQSRQADIIIFIDASDDNYGDTFVRKEGEGENFDSWPDGTTLRAVEQYARENSLPFPTIPVTGSENAPSAQICQVYQESGAPLVIYYPVARSQHDLNSELGDRSWNFVKADQPIVELRTKANNVDFQNTYATKHTDLSVDDANVLMAIMEYNVLYHAEQLLNAIGDWLKTQALSPTPTTEDLISSILKKQIKIKRLSLQEANAIIHSIDPQFPSLQNLEKAQIKLRDLLNQRDKQGRMIQSEVKSPTRMPKN